jgi:hypothetical protein
LCRYIACGIISISLLVIITLKLVWSFYHFKITFIILVILFGYLCVRFGHFCLLIVHFGFEFKWLGFGFELVRILFVTRYAHIIWAKTTQFSNFKLPLIINQYVSKNVFVRFNTSSLGCSVVWMTFMTSHNVISVRSWKTMVPHK